MAFVFPFTWEFISPSDVLIFSRRVGKPPSSRGKPTVVVDEPY